MWIKSSKLLGIGYDIRGIVLEEAERLEQQGVNILKLNIGNTAPFKLFASDTLLKKVSASLVDSQGYGRSSGIIEARASIVKYYLKRNIRMSVDDIYLGNGVSELISMCMNGLLNQGDEVLLPSPDYPLWTAAVRLSGGIPIYYMCDEANEWNPDVDDIKKKITPRTKAIVVINPNNPTGAVYSKDVLLALIEVAKAHKLLIFSDEIYDRVRYDGAEMHYMAQLTGDYPCIFFNGLSKAYRLPGFRVGWIGIHDPLKMLVDYIKGINMLSNMRLCSNVPGQWAIVNALEEDNEIDVLVAPGGRLYEQRKAVLKAIENIDGISAVRPKGAMYVFAKFDQKKFNLSNDEKLVLDILHATHVLLVHGRAFNYFDDEHVRIVFLPAVKELEMAMDKIKSFLHGYRQS